MPSFAEDINRQVPVLRALARAVLKTHCVQAADDLVQETLVLALRAEKVLRGSDVKVWCCSTLLRLHRARDLGGPATSRGGGFPDRRPTLNTTPTLPKDVARLDRMSLDEREVLLLAVIAGMTYAQVAATLHLSCAAVVERLTQAREGFDRPVLPAPPARPTGTEGPSRTFRRADHLRLVK